MKNALVGLAIVVSGDYIAQDVALLVVSVPRDLYFHSLPGSSQPVGVFDRDEVDGVMGFLPAGSSEPYVRS